LIFAVKRFAFRLRVALQFFAKGLGCPGHHAVRLPKLTGEMAERPKLLGAWPDAERYVASIWTNCPEEAVMTNLCSSLTSRTFAGLAVVSLTCAFTLQPLAQTPRSFLAIGSYAQQPPVRAMEETPQFALSPEMQGDIMMAHQRYIAALDAYRQGPEDSAVLWNKMGIANHHMFNLKDAQKDYEKALKLNPSYPEALNNLGAVYYGQKLYHDAERSYKKALKLSPKSAMFYSNLGTAYLAESKYKKGAECYRTALALDPNVFESDPAARIAETGPTHEIATLNYLLAKTYAQAGRKTEALLYLRKAIDEGFNDRKKLLEDKEFAILRDVPEYQQMIAEKRE
jgi:tetratricopeptide (TPR) repeat protein